jgi:plastocyanin
VANRTIARRAVRLLPLGALLWSLGSAGCIVEAEPSHHTVVMVGLEYKPATLRVRAGDTITWVNKDMFPHTATSGSGVFDSGQIGVDGSWHFTVERAGEYPYLCTYHPTMKGTLIVE